MSLFTNVGTFTTGMSEFTGGVRNQGWWSPTAINQNTNDNYIVGNDGNFINDFFTFSIPRDLGAITSAVLSIPQDFGSTRAAPFTYYLFDVSTDAATLNNNEGTSATIFEDLRSGTLYASILIPDNHNLSPLVITLYVHV